MQAGDTQQASAYLRKASFLAPNVGRYHWNRAALAHKEGRIGDCFLALQQFLACNDQIDDDKRSVARELVAQYGLSSSDVVQNDERDDQNSSPPPIIRRK